MFKNYERCTDETVRDRNVKSLRHHVAKIVFIEFKSTVQFLLYFCIIS